MSKRKQRLTRNELADRLLDEAKSDPQHPMHEEAKRCAHELATNFDASAADIMAVHGFYR